VEFEEVEVVFEVILTFSVIAVELKFMQGYGLPAKLSEEYYT
jgi:hypothetical protein